MKLAFKYNVEARGREGNDNTWVFYKNPEESLKDFFFVDYVEFHTPISTLERQIPDLGFGMTTKGEIKKDIDDLTGDFFTKIVGPDGEVKNKQEGPLLGIKYHVPSRGILGNDQIWRIYRNLDEGFSDTEYVEHIEIEPGVISYTGNDLYRVGFSLICKAQLECYIDEKTGQRHARIFKSE